MMRGLVKTIKIANKNVFQKRSTNTLIDSINMHSINNRLIQVENNYQNLDKSITRLNEKVNNLEKNLDKFIIHTDNKFNMICAFMLILFIYR
jgi:archaellum component FlaC